MPQKHKRRRRTELSLLQHLLGTINETLIVVEAFSRLKDKNCKPVTFSTASILDFSECTTSSLKNMSFVFSCKGQREMPKGGKIAPVDPCDDSLKLSLDQK